ncbi:tRNA lysidine(34) synthetase TilS [Ancylobacter sp. G4_0304]|uniref:tRNA lysidine(34) synthetase TilS n=1 Tax=Ancylobacter sp. G4_0304 TaxID=3114289 RepID=UPI0039C6ED63
MSAAEAERSCETVGAVAPEALPSLFAPFLGFDGVVLAVSGGPDSTALMLLAARWRAGLAEGPALFVATVDHGLRPEARREAEAVGALAAELGLPHAVLSWDGAGTRSGLQEAARHARYERLTAYAHAVGAGAVATAHSCDDQAETVLFRLMRGSGLSGLAGIPAGRALDADVTLLRPLLALRKAELVATCRAAGIGFVEDPSNRDPRFARARLRALMPQLAAEGLDAPRLARLAARLARADAALEVAVDAAMAALVSARPTARALRLDRAGLLALPEEIALRVLGRAVAMAGDGAPVELAKLEALAAWLTALEPGGSGARTLAGALVRVAMRAVTIAPAPPRRG